MATGEEEGGEAGVAEEEGEAEEGDSAAGEAEVGALFGLAEVGAEVAVGGEEEVEAGEVIRLDIQIFNI